MMEENILEVVAVIRDELKELAEKLDLMLESVQMDILTSRDGKVLAKTFRSNNSLTVILDENVKVGEGDIAIKHFLIPKVLERMKEKYQIEYSFEYRERLLGSLKVTGLPEGEEEKLKRAIAWTFEKAITRLL